MAVTWREHKDWAKLLTQTAEFQAQLKAMADEAAKVGHDIAMREAYSGNKQSGGSAKRIAKQAAKGKKGKKSGVKHYADSFEGTLVHGRDGTVHAAVRANDWKAKWIEFGTAKQAPKSIVRRAANTIGMVEPAAKKEVES